MIGSNNTLAARRRPAKTLIPLIPGGDNESLLNLAHWLAFSEPVLLLGIVPVPPGENLSEGALPARELRSQMRAHADGISLRSIPRIRVTYTPWDDTRIVLAEETSVDLLILDWAHHLEALDLTASEILSNPPCDVAIIRGPIPRKPSGILVLNRGGPHAERALSIGLTLARPNDAGVVSLNVWHPRLVDSQRKDFEGMAKILAEMPDVEQREIVTVDQANAVLEGSKEFDIVVLGTAASPIKKKTSFGKIADTILSRSSTAVVGVKTKRLVPERAGLTEFGSQAISVLVDRWFAENTFHADEFADLNEMVALKERQGLKISLVLPALNEEQTVGDIIQASQQRLMEKVPLLDEIVLMDSNSVDRTREIAGDLGVPVYIHQEVLSKYGPREGKGEALWKSVYISEGDLILWVDTDIRNFHPRFVYGLIGPLLVHPKLKFVKGFYRRPLKSSTGLRPGRGGRVTELAVRPLLNLFYPELSGVVQPLAGEYGARREALEQMSFSSGYGVETGLLIETFEHFGLSSMAQVDLIERIHRNRDLSYLSKMSFAIIQTLMSKLEKRTRQPIIEDVNRTMKIVRYESGLYHLDVEEIAERERPPMLEIPEYRKKHGLDG